MLGWRKDKTDTPPEPAAPASPPAAAVAPPSAVAAPVAVAPAGPAPATGNAVRHPRNRLGSILVEEGVITRGQLDEALKKKETEGGFLGQALIELRYIDQSTLINFLVKQCKIPHISLSDYAVSETLFGHVTKETCLKYNVLPIDKLGKILTIAMVDPLDTEALEIIQQSAPDLRIKPILCNYNDYNTLAGRLLGKEKASPQQATAGSFGLSEQKPKPKPVTDSTISQVGVQRPTVSSTTDSGIHSGVHTAPAVSSSGLHGSTGTDSPDIAGAIRSGVREAVQEALGTITAELKSSHGQSSSGPTAQEIATLLQDAVRSAMSEISQGLNQHGSVQDALGALASELKSSHGQSVPTGPTVQEIAGLLQETVRSAMSEMSHTLSQQFAAQAASQLRGDADPKAAELLNASFSQLTEQLQHAIHQQPTSASLDGEAVQQLASALSDGVKGAMREALNDVTERMHSVRPSVAETNQPAVTPEALAALVHHGVSTAVKEALAGLGETIRQSQPQHMDNGQNVHIAELAEAASQAVRAAEAAIEAARAVQQSQAAQMEMEESRRSRFRSVQPVTAGVAAGDGAVTAPRTERGDERVREALESSNTIPSYTFEGYFVSKPNEFAYNVSKAIAAAPGSEYNPLFLYGEVGTGKTHLINAVGNMILSATPGIRVGYVSAGLFARKLMEAVSERQADAFRENYCHWDVLILDDIQFLGYEVAAQEELFHIFNALYQEGRQIIIAADNPPDRLGKLEKRLVSRFTAGIVAKLEAPDFKTRMDILQYLTKKQNVTIGTEVLSIIATRIPNDMRKMNGALRKVIAFGKLVGQDITCDLAYEVLSHLNANEAA